MRPTNAAARAGPVNSISVPGIAASGRNCARAARSPHNTRATNGTVTAGIVGIDIEHRRRREIALPWPVQSYGGESGAAWNKGEPGFREHRVLVCAVPPSPRRFC